MKTIFSIGYAFYFLVAGIIPQTDFSQLTRYPDAWKHFRQHVAEARACGESFTLLDFLANHYLDPNNHDHEDSRSHEDLPLYHVLSGISPFSISSGLMPDEWQEQMQILNSIPVDNQSYNSADFISGLDRPPILS